MKGKLISHLVISLVLLLFIAGCSDKDQKVSGETNEKYVIKFAHVVNPTTAKGKAAEKFKELIEERTDGQITVEVFPDSQLGSDREILEQMQSGAIQMNAPFTGVLPSFSKEYEVFDLPYLFEDRDHAYEATNGELGSMLGEKLKSQGLHVLGFWDGGFKHLTNSVRPIETPKDMSGLKIRTSQSPLLITQFKAVNASGVSIDFAELYTALQTGTADGQENPLSNVISKRFYEVQDYITLSEHGYMGYVLTISDKFYQDLPDNLKSDVDEVAKEVTEWQWKDSIADEEGYMKTLKESGIEITELTTEQKQAFRVAMEEAYDVFAKIEGSEELLEAAMKQ
ncbi:TRAP transporter substrate-binding protein [Sporosarcina cascadiensis]|uniref:TRAP transporter substrate-binding protein n=1 Tax=Sporosarcina cascadiensis TaxID=2660747 RepID=UPI00129A557A|nr:TRAP transporter substrate-binding protein [Sporosarcina cascadiensis]